MKTQKSYHASELSKRMNWLGYEIQSFKEPFNDRVSLAIKRPGGEVQKIYVSYKVTDWDSLAMYIHKNPNDETIDILVLDESANLVSDVTDNDAEETDE